MVDSLSELIARISQTLMLEGIEVESPRELVGESGIKHRFDIVVKKGSERIVLDVVSSKGWIDEYAVLRYFVKAYDVNPAKMILIAHPRLTDGARRLASLYRIETLEAGRFGEVLTKVLRIVGKPS